MKSARIARDATAVIDDELDVRRALQARATALDAGAGDVDECERARGRLQLHAPAAGAGTDLQNVAALADVRAQQLRDHGALPLLRLRPLLAIACPVVGVPDHALRLGGEKASNAAPALEGLDAA